MLLIISDASVLIDIEHGDLTSNMFSLPYEFAAPDILFIEELETHYNIDVHGTIWLVKEMLHYNMLSKNIARLAFEKMKLKGSRLPQCKIEEILR